jgi:hypothetical protein
MNIIIIEVAGAGFHQNPGKLLEGEKVTLRRVPDNTVHSNAVAVIDSNVGSYL